jgi:NADP-dependent 3-hydroxy acid dehydrogenase YdfG
VTTEPGEALARLFDVRDLVVLVTGGASGLGLAIAQVLADCGAVVIVADRDEGQLDEADRHLPARLAAVDVTASSFMTGAVYPVDGGLLQSLPLPPP